jgi:hypothetical protein
VEVEQQITPKLIMVELVEEALVFLVKVLTALVVPLEVFLAIQQEAAADLVAAKVVAKAVAVKVVPVEHTAEVAAVVFLQMAHL